MSATPSAPPSPTNPTLPSAFAPPLTKPPYAPSPVTFCAPTASTPPNSPPSSPTPASWLLASLTFPTPTPSSPFKPLSNNSPAGPFKSPSSIPTLAPPQPLFLTPLLSFLILLPPSILMLASHHKLPMISPFNISLFFVFLRCPFVSFHHILAPS